MQIRAFFAPPPHLPLKKRRVLIKFPLCARFTDRSGRNGITEFEGLEGYRRGSQLCQGSLLTHRVLIKFKHCAFY